MTTIGYMDHLCEGCGNFRECAVIENKHGAKARILCAECVKSEQ